MYYIISIKHTSKGDTALTFWCANGAGYTWGMTRAGKYTEEEAKKHTDELNVMVECEKVDKFWMNAIDFSDKYISVPNTPIVRIHLGISDKLMKPKKFASCRMQFTNTPLELSPVQSETEVSEG